MIYCAVAVLITLAHAMMEYRDARTQLTTRLQQVEPLLKQSLSAAVWYLDIDQVQRLVHGIVDHQELLGVRVLNEEGEILVQHGQVPDEVSPPVSELAVRLEGMNDVTPVSGLLTHRFDLEPAGASLNAFDPEPAGLSLNADDEHRHQHGLGTVWLYSHDDIALGQVQQLFSWILLAALLKTMALWWIVSFFGKRMLARPLATLLDKLHALPVGEQEVPELAQADAAADEITQLHAALDGMGNKLHRTLAELRDANAQLSDSNWQLQRAIDQSPSSVTIFSTEGEVLYTNPAFTQITGYAATEAQQAFDHYLHQRQPLRGLMTRYMNGEIDEDRVYLEVENRRPGGSAYWIGVALSPVRSPSGEISHFLSSGTDISLRKQAEAALNRKTLEQQETIGKLEEAHNQLLQSEKMASIGQLAAGVAHEINNPVGYVNSNLGSLKLYIDDLFTLIEAYHGAVDDNARDAVADVAKQIDYDFLKEDLASLMAENEQGLERVKQIIKDLKDFSHVDAVEWVSSDLIRGLDSTLNVVWNELKYKCEVVKEYQPLPQIECMPSQLNQVFMNLLVNAAHAIETKGVVTVRTGSEGERVWVEVEDTGKGIADEHLTRLFEPFFTTKPVGKGTGLGLSVSYGIVNKHGGDIVVTSTVGKGSCFRVWLPIHQPVDASCEAV